jgi:hypothetical protein
MRRFARAAVVCAGAPLLAVGIVGAPVVWAAPGSNCSSSCTVGGADPNNPGNAKGGHLTGPVSPPLVGDVTESGTLAAGGAQGHLVVAPDGSFVPGTASGNFAMTPVRGHCTGDIAGVVC